METLVSVSVGAFGVLVKVQEITAPVDIIASISDNNLASWRLNLISLSDPANPVERDRLLLDGQSRDLALNGNSQGCEAMGDATLAV